MSRAGKIPEGEEARMRLFDGAKQIQKHIHYSTEDTRTKELLYLAWLDI